MSNFKPRHCAICDVEYIPTGNCSKHCTNCKPIATKRTQLSGQEAYRRRLGMSIGRGAKYEKENTMFRHGRCVFRRWAREKKNSLGKCELCNKDIKDAKNNQWVGHHIDHNPMNNVRSNLMILCKQCHQIEHKCWENFEGVTTSRKT